MTRSAGLTVLLASVVAVVPASRGPQVDAGLQVTISISKTEFVVGDPIDWTVTLKNTSAERLRVVKPEWYFSSNRTPAPPTAFVVQRDDGRIARQVGKCVGDDIGDTADKVSTVIAPDASLVSTVQMLRCWSFPFGADESPFFKPVPFTAGRYRVSIKYGFPPGTYSSRWWAFLGHRASVRDTGVNAPPPLLVEEPWHGEVTSNTVSIVVQRTSGVVSGQSGNRGLRFFENANRGFRSAPKRLPRS